jgi:hypothetical protein
MRMLAYGLVANTFNEYWTKKTQPLNAWMWKFFETKYMQQHHELI